MAKLAPVYHALTFSASGYWFRKAPAKRYRSAVIWNDWLSSFAVHIDVHFLFSLSLSLSFFLSLLSTDSRACFFFRLGEFWNLSFFFFLNPQFSLTIICLTSCINDIENETLCQMCIWLRQPYWGKWEKKSTQLKAFLGAWFTKNRAKF